MFIRSLQPVLNASAFKLPWRADCVRPHAADHRGLQVNAEIRTLLAQSGRLAVDVASLSDSHDLYAAGLTSFATVQLMLALEDAFDVEFPDRMLNRRTFASIASIEAALNEIAARPNEAAA